MTYGIEDLDKLYPINITLDDDQDNKRKDFFENGLRALLQDEHFLLLYVPEDGSKMRIVKPATDPYHRERIVKRINESRNIPSFYYALSHMWGISEEHPHYWNEIGNYVDDEDGSPAKRVSMREEKRETLLALLKAHSDTYWWVDVLCARTSTPLDIMGDIYSCCLECVAMIDCETSMIPDLYNLKSVVQEFPEDAWNNKDKKPDDLVPYEPVFKKYEALIDRLTTLFACRWWGRVWTWQEMALPFGNVRLMAETATDLSLTNTITVDELLDYFEPVPIRTVDVLDHLKIKDANYAFNMGDNLFVWFKSISDARKSNTHRVGRKSVEEFHNLIESLGWSTRTCMKPEDYVYGVLGMFQLQIPRMTEPSMTEPSMTEPSITNPSEVWQCFLIELDKYMERMEIKGKEFYGHVITGISHRAFNVDLCNAKNMADVYEDLLIVT